MVEFDLCLFSNSLTLSMAIRRDPRGLDEDEENWFDQDDDFDDVDLNPKVDLSKKLDLDYEPLGGRMLPTNKSACQSLHSSFLYLCSIV